MRQSITRKVLAGVAATCAVVFVRPSHSGPPLLGTSFTYQGELRQRGAPVNGSVDLQFSLFAAPSGGFALDGPYFVFDVPVVEGKFTVSVSHGIQHFTGAERYLGIAVRSPAGVGTYTTLAPRQRLSPTPYALQTRGIFVNSSGNAGIGAASPAARLHVDDGTDSAPAGGGYLILGDIAGTNLSMDNNEIMARNNGVAANLALNASGGNVNVVPNGGGNVGIGTSNAQARLHIIGGSDVSSASGGQMVIGSTTAGNLAMDNNEIMARNDGNTSTLFLNAEGGTVAVGDSAIANLTVTGDVLAGGIVSGELVAMFNTNAHAAIMGRNGSNGALVQWVQNNDPCGTIAVFDGEVIYSAFTGSHYGWIEATHPVIERGTVVIMTGSNRRANTFAPSEIIYGIRQSSRANDPACLGTYLGLEEPTEPASYVNPHLVMAVGNGEMWIIDTGSNVAPGDLLISSDVAGCAMKDDPTRFMTSHIVARAAERVDWNDVEAGADGVKRALISVLFDAFTRSTGDSADAIEELRRQNAELRASIERIVRQLERQ